METDKRWQDTSGSLPKEPPVQNEKRLNYYAAEDLERLFAVGGVSREELEVWIGNTFNLIRYMRLAGYTFNEICQRLGLENVRLGKKETMLYKMILEGYVKPTDSLAEIKTKMDKYYKLSRQSWNVAIQKLEKAGFIR